MVRRSSDLLGARIDLLRLIVLLRSDRFIAGANLNAARLQFLGHLSHKVDREQTVLYICPYHLHMVS